MLYTANYVKETCAGAGQGNQTLQGAVSGFMAYSDWVPNNGKTRYVIIDGALKEWGIGTVLSPTSFRRDTVRGNSAGTTAKLDLSGNTHIIYYSIPAEDVLSTDENQLLNDASPFRGALFIADFDALIDQDGLVTDETVVVRYGATLGDGLGGVFKWDPADATPEDGVDTFSSDHYPSGLWKRQFLKVQDPTSLTTTTSPAALGASQNNWSPTGYATASRIRLSSSIPVDLTGLAGGVDGRQVRLYNVGTKFIVLRHQNASSTVTNRFTTWDAIDAIIPPGAIVSLEYDSAINGGSWIVARSPQRRVLTLPLSNETAEILALTNAFKIRNQRPFVLQLVSASLNAASTVGPVTINIREAGTSIFTGTILTIPQGALVSDNSYVMTDREIAAGNEIEFDIVAPGDNAVGLKVTIEGVIIG